MKEGLGSPRVAVVTAAGRGIGRATALLLAQDGVTVVCVDRDREAAAAVASECRAFAGDASWQQVDLADLSATAKVVPDAVAKHGHLDILVNAAGIGHSGDTLTTSLEDWQLVQTVNLAAPFVLTQCAGRHFRDREGGGRIVNVSSSSAFRSRWAQVAYASSKAGMGGLTRAAAGDLAPYGVTVNAVVPGITATDTALKAFGGEKSAMIKAVSEGPTANLRGVPAEPEDVGAMIVFLCGPAGRHITAQSIHVSAGAVV
jgi:NAD(P)-dependent dehydrogenase (short-subunit alcohol dehydrogenase family)